MVGPLPPVPHGAAMVTEHVLGRLHDLDAARVLVYDTGAEPRTTPERLRTIARSLLSLLRPGRGLRSVYVTGAAGELLWFQVVLVTLARVLGHRVVFHHHNFSYLHERSLVMRLLTRCGGPRLEHVVLCPTMGRALQDAYPAVRHVTVCSNASLLAAPSDADAPPVRASDQPLVVGMLSNLTREKGVATAIDTLRELLAAGVDARMLLAGPCFGDGVEELVLEAVAELDGRLEWIGPVAPADVPDVYRRLDLFVFPTTYRNEAEPLVVLDAARLGVPSVVHATGCLEGMVAPAHAVPLGDDFAAAVVDLVQSGAVESSDAVRERYRRRRDDATASLDALLGRLTTL